MLNDVDYMRLAIEIASQGGKQVRPNPLVGAVIVKDGEIVGRGYHTEYGAPHAEREAIKDAGDIARGATMYVTLEPCNHHGQTPPCTDAILEAGINEVFIGMEDPNPDVSGGGAKKLIESGVNCHYGILEEECAIQNEVFLVNVLKKRPFINVKIAQTLDGFIAPENKNSRWITGEKARQEGHRLRSNADAIMVGMGTLLTDDPSLTVRHIHGTNPKRILLTDTADIPLDSKLFTDENIHLTSVIYPNSTSEKHPTIAELTACGITCTQAETMDNGSIDLHNVLHLLQEMNLYSILIEGGAGLYSSFLETGLVDKLDLFLAPKVFGKGISAFQEIVPRTVATAEMFVVSNVQTLGEDIHVVMRRK